MCGVTRIGRATNGDASLREHKLEKKNFFSVIDSFQNETEICLMF